MSTVGIIGSGTMGAGLAQVAAQAGWTVRLLDVDAARVASAIDGIRAQFARLVEKKKLAADQAEAAGARLHAAASPQELRDCDLVLEAVVENLMVKARVLRDAAAYVRPDAILATNTSSLSVDAVGQGAGQVGRTVGMHFFNPAPLMPLVEIVRGPRTHPAAAERCTAIAREWGKTPVQAADTPGFIVNRVARGFYLEPMRLLGEGVAGVDELDKTLRRLGGFRMGPFELMDLIGNDVNYAVTSSVWEQFGRPARLTPSELQKGLVDGGRLGRKTKQGWFSYAGEHPLPAVAVERRSFRMSDDVTAAVRRFADRCGAAEGSLTEQYVLARTLGAIINEAALALDDETATREDIDTAMKLGTNYPAGPFEWIERIGRATCRHVLEVLNGAAGDGRFAPAGSLRPG